MCKILSEYSSACFFLQVLGHAPYKLLCYLPTRQLAYQIMRHIHTPEDTDEENYIRNLAMFVSVSYLLLTIDAKLCLANTMYLF